MSLPQFTATSKLAETDDTKVPSVVRAFNALASNLQQIFTSLLGRVQLDSVLLPGIKLTTGANVIQHTLGRTLTGWTLTRLDSPAIVYDEQVPAFDPAKYLVLVATVPCVVSLEVF